MSNAQHTRGPWSGGTSWEILSCSGDECPVVARVLPQDARGERLANVRLIAESPELLWFCEQILNSNAVRIDSDYDETLARVIARGRAAIARARGQS